MLIEIDLEKCNNCGICGVVCPRYVLATEEIDGQKATRVVEERLPVCMGCGQCVAVCPREAVTVEGLPDDRFLPRPPLDLDYDSLTAFFSRRRSIRRYADKPVEREVLDRLARAAGLAPCGTGRSATGVLIIDRPELLRELSGHIFKLYKGLAKALSNPIGRFFVRRSAGPLNYRVLQDFVMPGMHWYIRWRDEGVGDEILRDCPALMLLHTPEFEPTGKENCVVAAWHAVFVAETLGIGTCMNDLIPPACNRSPEIRQMLGLPPDHEVMVSLTVGYPKFKYRKAIARELTSLRYLD